MKFFYARVTQRGSTAADLYLDWVSAELVIVLRVFSERMRCGLFTSWSSPPARISHQYDIFLDFSAIISIYELAPQTGRYFFTLLKRKGQDII